MCFMRICEFVTINSRCTDFLRSTGPICARAPIPRHRNELSLRGHHDWPLKPTIRQPSKSVWTVDGTKENFTRLTRRLLDFDSGGRNCWDRISF